MANTWCPGGLNALRHMVTKKRPLDPGCANMLCGRHIDVVGMPIPPVLFNNNNQNGRDKKGLLGY